MSPTPSSSRRHDHPPARGRGFRRSAWLRGRGYDGVATLIRYAEGVVSHSEGFGACAVPWYWRPHGRLPRRGCIRRQFLKGYNPIRGSGSLSAFTRVAPRRRCEPFARGWNAFGVRTTASVPPGSKSTWSLTDETPRRLGRKTSLRLINAPIGRITRVLALCIVFGPRETRSWKDRIDKLINLNEPQASDVWYKWSNKH